MTQKEKYKRVKLRDKKGETGVLQRKIWLNRV